MKLRAKFVALELISGYRCLDEAYIQSAVNPTIRATASPAEMESSDSGGGAPGGLGLSLGGMGGIFFGPQCYRNYHQRPFVLLLAV
jgi:hypothetical protein